jgi:hypothetical protein
MDLDMAHTEAEPPTSSGTENPPVGTRGHPTTTPERPLLSWPIATVAILAAVLVLLLGGSLLLRQLTGPATPTALAPTAVVTSAPTAATPPVPVAAPQTIAPATLQPANTVAPTVVSTPPPTAAPTAQPTALPTTAAQPVAASGQSPEPTALPTVPPELRQEVESAYTQYWDARAQAVWDLDPAPLDAVATGDELLALRHDVEQLRTDGRAIKAEVQHQYTVVSVAGDEAQVLDHFRDFSIYIDPETKQALPGENRPDEANAPLNTALYYMRRIDGAWKVERGERYANN